MDFARPGKLALGDGARDRSPPSRVPAQNQWQHFL